MKSKIAKVIIVIAVVSLLFSFIVTLFCCWAAVISIIFQFIGFCIFIGLLAFIGYVLSRVF
jgi:hypothetical protein